MDKLLVKVPEAAKMLSISRSATYVLLAERRIRSVKIGKSRLVDVDSIRSFIADLPIDTGLTEKGATA
ncbi:MAG: helix-turn-helix domain-containing protein [Acidobacteriota bacterium]